LYNKGPSGCVGFPSETVIFFQSESLTENNETPIVSIDKKKSKKSKVKDKISNKENETPVAHVEKQKSRSQSIFGQLGKDASIRLKSLSWKFTGALFESRSG
jgi:hypothetical protein